MSPAKKCPSIVRNRTGMSVADCPMATNRCGSTSPSSTAQRSRSSASGGKRATYEVLHSGLFARPASGRRSRPPQDAVRRVDQWVYNGCYLVTTCSRVARRSPLCIHLCRRGAAVLHPAPPSRATAVVDLRWLYTGGTISASRRDRHRCEPPMHLGDASMAPPDDSHC